MRPNIIFLTLFSFLLPAAEVRVLDNFTLIDGTGRPALRRVSMVISDGRIQWIGPHTKRRAHTGADIVDLSGRFVMPGIINLHGHIGNVVDLQQDPANYTRDLNEAPGNYTRQTVEHDLRTYASYGVTSVLTLGTDRDLIFELRAKQRSGRPRMTRIFTAGRGFAPKNPGSNGFLREVETSEQVSAGIDELARQKADFVKIWVDDRLGSQRKLPFELSKAVLDSARRRSLRVVAHIFYLQDARELVDAGLYGLAHSVRDQPVDDALIRSMKRHGAWQAAATLTREVYSYIYAQPPAFLDSPFFQRSVSPDVISILKSPEYRARFAADQNLPRYPGFFEMAKKNLKRLADAGVKYGFGTDSGPPGRFPGYSEHWEMELMVEAGLTPAQVITAATRSSAEFLGVSKDLGTLEPGRWADLIVLSKNPLDNIRNTREIHSVYIAGNPIGPGR